MVMVFVTGIDALGQPYSCGVGGYTLEKSFEEAVLLVRSGGVLHRVEVQPAASPLLLLAIDLFEGSSAIEAVADARRQWQQLRTGPG